MRCLVRNGFLASKSDDSSTRRITFAEANDDDVLDWPANFPEISNFGKRLEPHGPI